jgi:CubicO group peptidase (beta-lactamase class C family)
VLVAAGLGAAASMIGATGTQARTTSAGPPTVTAADLRFTPGTTLRPGRPEQVGLLAEPVARMVPDAARYLTTTPHPLYAGGTVLAAKDGRTVQLAAVGQALKYGLDGTTVVELPADQQIPARTDTVWDLASMSKLFCLTSVVQLIERGRVDLTSPVARYLPDFAANGKSGITVRQLLTHTSGLIPDPVPSLWQGYPTYDQRVAAILATTPQAPPDTRYVYSDLNFMTLGLLVQEVTGQRLDAYVAEHVTGPLGMRDTMYNPPAALRPRTAATEYQPWTNRGIVWGQVHDENAWALEGVSGHAGVFSTAADLAVFAQLWLNGGRYGQARLLSEDTVRRSLTDYNTPLGFPSDPHGLGWELNLHWYMGAISSPVTFGHTGYTGTDLVADPVGHQFVVFLTNRVHPSRDWGSNNVARRAMVDDLGLASPVRPAVGPTDWFAGRVDHHASTLVVPLRRPAPGGGRLDFRLWYDTEAGYDLVTLESSVDGSTWAALAFALSTGGHHWTTDGTVSGWSGRRWLSGAADLPAGTTALRWRYTTDPEDQGRGVYLDGLRAYGHTGLLFDGETSADAARIVADGWTVATT